MHLHLVDENRSAAEGVSTALCLDIYHGWSVTHAALQITYFMSFQSVLIPGIDSRCQHEGHPNALNNKKGPDPNQFVDSSFQACMCESPDLNHPKGSYCISRHAYERDGRLIIDYTVGGAFDVYENSSLAKVFP